jgi:ATP-binding cassette subfamily B protein
VDQGIIGEDTGALVAWTAGLVVAGVVQAVLSGRRRHFAVTSCLRAEAGLRNRLFGHFQRLHFAYHDHAQTGQLMSRTASDARHIRTAVQLTPHTTSSIFALVVVAWIMIAENASLALLALSMLPLVTVLTARFSVHMNRTSLRLQEDLGELSTVVEDTVSGIRVLKGFGAEPFQATRMEERTHRVRDRGIELGHLRASFLPWTEFLPSTALVAVIWYGGYQQLAGNLTVGQIVEFTAYVLLLTQPVRAIGQVVSRLQQAVAAATRVNEVFATSPAITDPPRPVELAPGNGELRFSGVRFSYEDRPVLDGLDLTIDAGQSVALVGPAGCGKTTLAQLLPRFYDVDAGRVLLDGVDVRELRLADLRRAVGVVFEETLLFSGTMRDNIAFACPEASDDEVVRAARLAGAHEFIDALPHRYDTPIGQRGFSLSGGQRQRVAIARTILADPRVLILDDATSSVDPGKEREIGTALAEVMRDRTTVIIAHRPATIALAERVVLLEEGRVVATGSHDELLATSPDYRRVLAQDIAEVGA